tara:strand:- start:836 stop:1570 length:735 start_codon:yes stop_codon:yes gene_type:complete
MNTTVDTDEIQKFQSMATEWWDPKGKFKPLHMLNPTRLDYINSQISYEFNLDLKKPIPFKGLNVLDIGCGGGLLSEPIARLGATVTGADASERNIKIAKAHAETSDVKVRYIQKTAEDLVTAGEKYDVILNMEVIEHVADTRLYLNSCKKLLKNGGLMVCSTINRNLKSYVMAIVGAEYILKWLPKGTHDWNKFITPNELYAMLEASNLKPVDKKGFLFNPISWSWSISERDLSVNYVTTSLNE